MEKKIAPLLRKHPEGLGFLDIVRELRLPRQNKNKLLENLKALENEGVVRRVRNRYTLAPRTNLVRGRLVSVLRGFGFVTPEGGGTEDIFIPARDSGGALQGDTVEVLVREKGSRGKSEGKIIRILKKERKRILGTYVERGGAPYMAAFDSMSPEELPIRVKGKPFPRPGMIIEADRTTLELAGILGFPDDPGVDTQVIVRRHGLASEFSAEVLAEAAAVRTGITAEDMSGRTDHRAWQTVTIDGEKAQDFDDAVSVRFLPNGHYLLGVHIADVSHYVRPGTAIDVEAYARATSVYFPDLTLPMLPERLSNDVCSLRPREDRLTVSAVMEIDAAGNVLRADFHPSITRTTERLSYTSVFKIFEGDEAERRRLAPLVPDLMMMRKLARLLREKRVAEGSLNFDLLEPELVYREGRLHSIATFAQNEAHKLIEEFMVAANVAVASFLGGKGIPSLYRVHPQPAVSDLEKLRETLVHFGIVLPKPEKIRSVDLERAIREAEGKPGEKSVNVQVLRALRLAVYSDENVGHYGLAKKEYTHFTSPIRRYPDLVVHRILKQAIRGLLPETPSLAAIALHASGQERKADGAEQDLVEWRIFRFLKEKLGEEFTGIVVDITRAGLVVELDDYFVKGLLAYEDLGGDYFRQKTRAVLAGKRTGKKFELGQTLRVSLAAVDPVLKRMSLVLADP